VSMTNSTKLKAQFRQRENSSYSVWSIIRQSLTSTMSDDDLSPQTLIN
jgi:hypothetical protein